MEWKEEEEQGGGQEMVARIGKPICQNGGDAAEFLRGKGLPEVVIASAFRRCLVLPSCGLAALRGNWDFLAQELGVPLRRMPSVIRRCPQLLVLSPTRRLRPLTHILLGLGSRPAQLAAAVTRYPHLLTRSPELKLCPLLALLQALGIPDTKLPKLLLAFPRIVSYSIEAKLLPALRFLSSIGVANDDLPQLLTKCPHILGYSVERRLKPTADFLGELGLPSDAVARISAKFPQILCRDVERVLRPRAESLCRAGFSRTQIVALITGHPPLLIKSVRTSLHPKLEFLVAHMGHTLEDAVGFPAFFACSLSQTIKPRHRKLAHVLQPLPCPLQAICHGRRFAKVLALAGTDTNIPNPRESTPPAQAFSIHALPASLIC